MGSIFEDRKSKLNMFNQVIRFCQESFHELKMSSWLSRQQMIGHTIVVVILTVLVSIYVACIDRILLWMAGIFFSIR
jgi:preprotein translocase SecE subunit